MQKLGTLECSNRSFKLFTVHAGKKLVHKHEFARAPSFASAIAFIIRNCTCDPRFVYPQFRVSLCGSMSSVSFRTEQGNAEL